MRRNGSGATTSRGQRILTGLALVLAAVASFQCYSVRMALFYDLLLFRLKCYDMNLSAIACAVCTGTLSKDDNSRD